MKTVIENKKLYQSIDDVFTALDNTLLSAGKNSKLYFLLQVMSDTYSLKDKYSHNEQEFSLMLMHRLKETYALITERGIFAPPPEVFYKFAMALCELSASIEVVVTKIRERILTFIEDEKGLRAYFMRDKKMLTESIYSVVTSLGGTVPKFADPDNVFALVFDVHITPEQIEQMIEQFYTPLGYSLRTKFDTDFSRQMEFIIPTVLHHKLTVLLTFHSEEVNGNHCMEIEIHEDLD